MRTTPLFFLPVIAIVLSFAHPAAADETKTKEAKKHEAERSRKAINKGLHRERL